MSMPLTAAVLWDNIGGNDPEVQMTLCLWLTKMTHIVF